MDVFAVGTNGTVVRNHDGFRMIPRTVYGETLNAIWGSSSRDVFIVGNNGLIIHYEGSAGSMRPGRRPRSFLVYPPWNIFGKSLQAAVWSILMASELIPWVPLTSNRHVPLCVRSPSSKFLNPYPISGVIGLRISSSLFQS